MGIHTYFYTSYDKSVEELIPILKTELERKLHLCQYAVLTEDWIYSSDYYSVEEQKLNNDWELRYLSKLVSMFHLFSEKTLGYLIGNHLLDESDRALNYEEKSNKLYVNLMEDGYHDLFRVTVDSMEILYSFEDTVKFLEENSGYIKYYRTRIKSSALNNPNLNQSINLKDVYKIPVKRAKKETLMHLKDFWNTFPDGLIRFE